MDSCPHRHLLVLLPERRSLRCRHCHLKLRPEELVDGCCPECLEVSDARRRDFEEIEPDDSGPVRYRCEDCGALIEWDRRAGGNT
jgi:hypothetical protein